MDLAIGFFWVSISGLFVYHILVISQLPGDSHSGSFKKGLESSFFHPWNALPGVSLSLHKSSIASLRWALIHILRERSLWLLFLRHSFHFWHWKTSEVSKLLLNLSLSIAWIIKYFLNINKVQLGISLQAFVVQVALVIRWVDGWKDGLTDGWMGEWMDDWKGRQIDSWTDFSWSHYI